jgi:hypothetical protein
MLFCECDEKRIGRDFGDKECAVQLMIEHTLEIKLAQTDVVLIEI